MTVEYILHSLTQDLGYHTYPSFKFQTSMFIKSILEGNLSPLVLVSLEHRQMCRGQRLDIGPKTLKLGCLGLSNSVYVLRQAARVLCFSFHICEVQTIRRGCTDSCSERHHFSDRSLVQFSMVVTSILEGAFQSSSNFHKAQMKAMG